MIDRRKFLGIAAGAGATLALTPELLRALQHSGATPELINALQQSQGKLIQRAIPSTGELLPVIGAARGPVQNNARLAHLVNMADPSSEAYAMLKAVVKSMVENGGRVLDSGNAEGQQVMGMIAGELGVTKRIFWSTGVPLPPLPNGSPAPDAATVKAHLDSVFTRFKVSKIDLLTIGLSNPYFVSSTLPTVLAVAKEAKKEGRIRYIGMSELPTPNNPYAKLQSMMKNEPIDFISVPHYHMANRAAEESLLPLAQERKIGVMVNMPFDLGRLFRRAGSTPLPEWAADFDAKTWAQFFLKYIVSHPAVTCVLPGTSSAAHMLDNMGGGIGRLPNEATRKRMAELVDSFPQAPAQSPPQASGRVTAGSTVALSAAILDRYVGEYKAASGTTATIRRDGDKLVVKPGSNPEAPLIAQSETRFQDPRGPIFEFQLDAQGRVTGVMLEQRSGRTLLERKN